MDISSAWGYGAIVFPRKMQWQGFVIIDPADVSIAAVVKRAIESACIALSWAPADPRLAVEGALSASITECYLQRNESGLGIFSSALSQYTGHRFWIIDAVSEVGGIVTTIVPLEVTSPEAARKAIDSRVAPLRMGQLLKTM